MSESVSLPALGESVTEGTVTRWLKKVGDRIEVDADAAEWLLANDIAAREPKPVRTPTDPSVDLSPIQRKEPKQ